MSRPFLVAVAAFLLFLLAMRPAAAAESYDNCAGTIEALPAIVSSQGVWCVKKDLTTLSATGSAITVTAPNVTIDCNDFKVGGLGAGPDTLTVGIHGNGVSNLTVRNCNVRGFRIGIHVDATSGGGHLIENNRLDGNTRLGIYVFGDGSRIRGNNVIDTGGGLVGGNTIGGILADGDVDIIDNTIRNVTGEPDVAEFAIGIFHNGGTSGVIDNNRISGVLPSATGTANGMIIYSTNLALRNNIVANPTAVAAMDCLSASVVARGNMRTGLGTTLDTCTDGGDNTAP